MSDGFETPGGKRRLPSGRALRRYPAVTVLVTASLLATLLPSALRLPLSGPTAAAELAPVSGDSGLVGDLGRLGGTGSTGLGSGSEASGVGTDGGAGGAGDAAPTGGEGDNPASKRCVGRSPARQTEDPLSPLCVAFFTGDNGGATAPGVTRDEVRVVVFYDCNDEPAYEIDYGGDGADHPNADPAVTAYQRFFNERYQTYGRFVRFFAVKHTCSQEVTTSERRSHVNDVVARYTPFAVITRTSISVSSSSLDYDLELARNRVITIPSSNRPRHLMQQHAPYLLSFDPDREDDTEQAAAFMCQKLVGFTATYSGNVADRGRVRKFGFIHEDEDPAPLISAIGRRCGVKREDVVVVRTTDGKPGEAAGIATLRRNDVTTVVRVGCWNCPLNWSPEANAAQWYPEWFLPGAVPDTTIARVHPPLEWANAFITSYRRRQGPRSTQPWHQAYREGCPDCPEPSAGFGELFDRLTLLFWGIQSAGPRLTPGNVDRGLHALPARPSPDPFTPAAYFAPGNYSFVKDAMVAWWDPAARAPDGETGCWRLAESGRRSRAVDWTRGQVALRTDDMPCQVP